jgi:4-hydroxyphenylacetate 3-monooxygenase
MGTEYLDALNRSHRDVRIHGERLTGNVANHPAFRGVARAYAAMFDLQHDARFAQDLTYLSPTTGTPVATSFLQPRTAPELAQRGRRMKVWADLSFGWLGRTGDYLNSALMAMAAAADWFGQVDAAYATNIRRYYERVREDDLLLTHSVVHPQSNRSVGVDGQRDPHQAAAIVRETDAGVVIRGARMLATIGPIADEILMFPSTVVQGRAEEAPYAYVFALPCDAPGLRFVCRESLDHGRSHFDHPLGSRFDEMDAVVVFDDVLIPYERCFMIGHPELVGAGRMLSETTALVHMAHQVVVRDLTKTEFFLGLMTLICDAIQIGGFPHVQEKIAEVIDTRELLAAVLRAAEADSAPNAWGIQTPAWAPLNSARHWFPRVYPRLKEAIWQLAASGLFGLPTEADVRSETRADIDRYLQSATLDGFERVRLFRLAWDASASAFAGRQEVFEYFYFGDPVRTSQAIARAYDVSDLSARVQAFLSSSDVIVVGPRPDA